MRGLAVGWKKQGDAARLPARLASRAIIERPDKQALGNEYANSRGQSIRVQGDGRTREVSTIDDTGLALVFTTVYSIFTAQLLSIASSRQGESESFAVITTKAAAQLKQRAQASTREPLIILCGGKKIQARSNSTSRQAGLTARDCLP
jgi:hypothetical protein